MIAAIADSYRISGNLPRLRAQLPQARRAWSLLAQYEVRRAAGSRFLLYADVGPHVAADWVDQVARSGYATGIEALWYHATRAMAVMEEAVGNTAAAARFDAFAAGVKHDINRLLWRTGAPRARDAAPTGPTGHYTGWLGARDYFELDSNYLCILYGIAGPVRTDDILRFTTAHASYLLGLGLPGGIPARTVYGDYEPEDYARIHYKLADGTYQNAYWPSIGALVAMAGCRACGRSFTGARSAGSAGSRVHCRPERVRVVQRRRPPIRGRRLPVAGPHVSHCALRRIPRPERRLADPDSRRCHATAHALHRSRHSPGATWGPKQPGHCLSLR